MVTRHPIRKIFVKTQDAGDEPAYWDHQWEDVNAAAKARKASEDPSSLERLIAAGLASGPILEAGCGSGWAVEWLASLGPLTVGLDFARRSLGQAKSQFPDKSFVAGDLERLPFADASFGTVVSLGALEHIELGPARALSEHRRVLMTGGRLLITLPRISWIKAANDLVGRRGGRIDHYLSPRGRWVSREAQFTHEDAGDLRFVQYELWANEWKVLLGRSGFDVVSYTPVLGGAGLGESALVKHLATSAGAGGGQSPTGTQRQPARTGRLRSVWRSAVLQQPTTATEHAASRVMGLTFGHMAFFVAEAR